MKYCVMVRNNIANSVDIFGPFDSLAAADAACDAVDERPEPSNVSLWFLPLKSPTPEELSKAING